jgi:hypothetical protein
MKSFLIISFLLLSLTACKTKSVSAAKGTKKPKSLTIKTIQVNDLKHSEPTPDIFIKIIESNSGKVVYVSEVKEDVKILPVTFEIPINKLNLNKQYSIIILDKDEKEDENIIGYNLYAGLGKGIPTYPENLEIGFKGFGKIVLNLQWNK